MTETNECTHGYTPYDRRHCVHCMYADEIADKDAEIKRLRAQLDRLTRDYEELEEQADRWREESGN